MKGLLNRDGADELRSGVHRRLLRALQLDEGGVLLRPREREQVLEAHARPLCVPHRAEAPLHAGHMRREEPPAVARALQDGLELHLRHALEIGERKRERLLHQAMQVQPPARHLDLGDVEVIAQIEALDGRDPGGERRTDRLVVERPFGHPDQLVPSLRASEAGDLQPPGGGGGAGQRRLQETSAIEGHRPPGALPMETLRFHSATLLRESTRKA